MEMTGAVVSQKVIDTPTVAESLLPVMMPPARAIGL